MAPAGFGVMTPEQRERGKQKTALRTAIRTAIKNGTVKLTDVIPTPDGTWSRPSEQSFQPSADLLAALGTDDAELVKEVVLGTRVKLLLSSMKGYGVQRVGELLDVIGADDKKKVRGLTAKRVGVLYGVLYGSDSAPAKTKTKPETVDPEPEAEVAEPEVAEKSYDDNGNLVVVVADIVRDGDAFTFGGEALDTDAEGYLYHAAETVYVVADGEYVEAAQVA